MQRSPKKEVWHSISIEGREIPNLSTRTSPTYREKDESPSSQTTWNLDLLVNCDRWAGLFISEQAVLFRQTPPNIICDVKCWCRAAELIDGKELASSSVVLLWSNCLEKLPSLRRLCLCRVSQSVIDVLGDWDKFAWPDIGNMLSAHCILSSELSHSCRTRPPSWIIRKGQAPTWWSRWHSYASCKQPFIFDCFLFKAPSSGASRCFLTWDMNYKSSHKQHTIKMQETQFLLRTTLGN